MVRTSSAILKKMDTNDFICEILLDEIDEELLLANSVLCRKSEHDMFVQRPQEGYYNILVKKYLYKDEVKFREYFRVSRKLFFYILSNINQDILKQPCNRIRKPISPEEKLCVTLRYMATGESFRSLAFGFRISNSYISQIIKAVLKAICNRLLHKVIPQPTENTLRRNAEKFHRKWNFPNCVASLNGKHIRIIAPSNSGSLHFNYKRYFSIVLLALVDADYKFIAIDVGGYGKEGDAGLFAQSHMGRWINAGTFPFPPSQPLTPHGISLPFVILGDEAFKLTPHLMRPFPKEQSNSDREKAIYNYRHSRARRTSENGFGILCQYFRIFFTPIAIDPNTANDLVTASCIIHNLLREERIPCPGEESITESNSIPLPTENVLPFQRMGANATFEAYNIRNSFKDYFCSREGRLIWQLGHVTRTN